MDLYIKMLLKSNKIYKPDVLHTPIIYKIKVEFEHLNYTSSLRSKGTTQQCSKREPSHTEQLQVCTQLPYKELIALH